MANRAVQEKNRAQKGRTGPLTIQQRKTRGIKARPHKAAKAKGKAR